MIELYVGIDTGVNTGVAVWNKKQKRFVFIESLMIHQAIDFVCKLSKKYSIFVRVEDARQRKWFGENAEEKKQGAGSVKRDSKIWDDFLKDKGIPYEMVSPAKNKTKLDSKMFRRITKYTGETNEHKRDAAMLVFGI